MTDRRYATTTKFDKLQSYILKQQNVPSKNNLLFFHLRLTDTTFFYKNAFTNILKMFFLTFRLTTSMQQQIAVS